MARLPGRGRGCRAALIEIIRNSLTLLGIDTFWEGAFVGTFIVVVVAFDSVRSGRRTSAG